MTPFWPAGCAIEVTEREATPVAFVWQGRTHRIRRVSRHWRVHTNWWPDGGGRDGASDAISETWRDYWEVVTDTDLLCVLYHELVAERWYLERIFE
jgi:hypothetical protein